MEDIQQAAGAMPAALRQRALSLSLEKQAQAEELRLRTGRPLSVVLPGEERSLGGPPLDSRELEQVVEIASHASFHAVQDQVRRGYLTMAGGHRIGLCGTAVMRAGEIYSLGRLSSVNIRIARQVIGAADPVLAAVCPDGRLTSTLILAPPGLGKTTLLRDLIRQVSDGQGCISMRVSVADERGEVAGMYQGRAQLDVGGRTDVLEGCPKAQGLMLLLRSMNPQVLAADEITAPEDVLALRAAVGCGVVLLATAHGESRMDLERRALYRPVLEEHLFQKLVRIRQEGGRRYYHIEELD